LRVLVVLVCLAALCVAAFALLHSPLFSARHVKVRGNLHTSVAAVMSAAALTDHPPLVDLDPGRASARLEKLPWVASAVVEREWPDSVTVVIVERLAVASISLPAGGVAVVDGTGRVLADEPSAPPGTLAMSVPAPPGRPGSSLVNAAAYEVAVARELPVVLRAHVQEVTPAPGGGVDLDLAGGVKVSLGPDAQLDAKFEALESLLAADVLGAPATVDLSVPDQPSVSPAPPGG